MSFGVCVRVSRCFQSKDGDESGDSSNDDGMLLVSFGEGNGDMDGDVIVLSRRSLEYLDDVDVEAMNASDGEITYDNASSSNRGVMLQGRCMSNVTMVRLTSDGGGCPQILYSLNEFERRFPSGETCRRKGNTSDSFDGAAKEDAQDTCFHP